MTFDLGDTFTQLFNLSPATGVMNDSDRAAISFTSTFRRIVLSDAVSDSSALANARNSAPFAATRSQQARDLIVADARRQNIDIESQLDHAMPIITMALNPKSVKFSQPKRFVKKDVRNGSVYFHFANNKGQNNDILTMTFAGNTGNIDLRGTFDTVARDPSALQSGTAVDEARQQAQDTGALRKLLVWHNLYQLSREPMLLANNTQNEFFITYISPLFPVPVEFTGFFSRVVDFEENAAKPNSRDYSFEFIVTRTEPDLDFLVGKIFRINEKITNLTVSETATLLNDTAIPTALT